jgi:hypothetical protein
MSHPHPAPVIASVLRVLADRIEKRMTGRGTVSRLVLSIIVEELRATAKELK